MTEGRLFEGFMKGTNLRVLPGHEDDSVLRASSHNKGSCLEGFYMGSARGLQGFYRENAVDHNSILVDQALSLQWLS